LALQENGGQSKKPSFKLFTITKIFLVTEKKASNHTFYIALRQHHDQAPTIHHPNMVPFCTVNPVDSKMIEVSAISNLLPLSEALVDIFVEGDHCLCI
jgi:hypothetical protein